MPANTTPIFILTGDSATASLTGANTASDGSGNLVTLISSGTNGTRVDAIRFRNSQPGAGGTASSLMIHKIFLSDTNGANFKMIGEVSTAAATRSTAAVGASSIFTFDQPVIMRSGQIMSVCQTLYAGTQDRFDAFAYAGDY